MAHNLQAKISTCLPQNMVLNMFDPVHIITMQSNGKAEAVVKQAKKMMRRCAFLALLTMRNMPQQQHEMSHVQRLLNRRTKTHLPTKAKFMKPQTNKNTAQHIRKAQEMQPFEERRHCDNATH